MTEAQSHESQAGELRQQAEGVMLEETKKDKTMRAWLIYQFESSSGLTDEYALFARQFKRYIMRTLSDNLELVSWNRGHFYVSGFVLNKTTNKYCYFSCDDIRGSNGWYDNLLIRTATGDKDYTGGSNDWTKLPDLADKAAKLTS